MNGGRWPRGLTLSAGLLYTLIALAMLTIPRWFFEALGHFPPYNRHYIGDTAAFTLPIGVALIWASRDLDRYRSLLSIGLAASGLHAGNHILDAVGEPLSHWLLDVVPLILITVTLLAVGWRRIFPAGSSE